LNRYSNVIGIDDAPFDKNRDDRVLIVGAIYADTRLIGVLSTHVAPDGDDGTAAIATMIRRSKFSEQIQAVLLQGIAMAGFNVIDIHALHESLAMPVLAVARHVPDMLAIRRILLSKVGNGKHKWELIEKAGAMQPAGNVYVQRAGLSLAEACAIIERFAVNGNIPEPLRSAHLIAGGIAQGESHGRT